MNIYNISENIININLLNNHNDLSNKILQYSNDIISTLGNNLTESVYHRSLELELRSNGHSYTSEVVIPIKYKGHSVGVIRPDIILEDKYILELKAIPSIKKKEINQLKTYLKHSNYEFGLLINFTHSSEKAEVIFIIK